MEDNKGIVIVFKTQGLGTTDELPLKEKLAKSYLNLALQMEPLPSAICFYTDGVRLACQGDSRRSCRFPLLPVTVMSIIG